MVGCVVQGGFGLIGDLLFGVIGAIGANFLVSVFNLFNVDHYGLPGALILAIIGSILLVVLVHLFTFRRSASHSVVRPAGDTAAPSCIIGSCISSYRDVRPLARRPHLSPGPPGTVMRLPQREKE